MLQPEVRCVEFVDEVTEWMEGGLTDDERLLLEEHSPPGCGVIYSTTATATGSSQQRGTIYCSGKH